MSMLSRYFRASPLILASHNCGKLDELSEFLVPFVSSLWIASDLALSAPEEVGKSFVANAVIKARDVAMRSGFTALGDDSGLVVHSLGGQPGLYSARWAGPERDFRKAMQQVHDRLGTSHDRSAAFVCALCLAWPDDHIETVEAQVSGTIVWPPRGQNGFGYDPIFQPQGYTVTFGEMMPKDKQAISHRTLAIQKLIERCFASVSSQGDNKRKEEA